MSTSARFTKMSWMHAAQTIGIDLRLKALITADYAFGHAFERDTAKGNAVKGTYAITGSSACLNSPTGFTAALEPVNPSLASSGSGGFSGTFDFSGDGQGEMNLSEVVISVPPVPLGVPAAGSETISGSFAYTISGNNISVSAPNLIVTVQTGPNRGATGTLDVIAISGLVAADKKGLTLASATPAILTTVFANGFIVQAICWFLFVLLK
jgi:hypothetical protein